jgi:hypothetical protein
MTVSIETSSVEAPVPGRANSVVLSNNGMQLTKAARCAPAPVRAWGQSLRRALQLSAGVIPTVRSGTERSATRPRMNVPLQRTTVAQGLDRCPVWRRA